MIYVTLGTLVACLVVVGVLVYQHRQLQQHLLEQRDRAVRAVEHGRYAEARTVLKGYLHHVGAHDTEAMAALARALLSTPAPSRADRVYAMRLLERVAALDEEHLAARIKLVELQRELGFDEAVASTAEAVLAMTHDPVLRHRARRAQAQALLRLERYSAALEVAADMVHHGPDPFDAHHLVLEIVAAGPWPAREVVDYARELVQNESEDVRYAVLSGAAHRLAGRTPEAAAVLARCATQPMPDADTARRLITELEATGRFDTALEVLECSAQAFDDAQLHGMLVGRLWQRGRKQAALDQIAAMRSAGVPSDGGAVGSDLETSVVAIKAMALMRTQGRSAAEPWLDVLRRRSVADGAAAAWSVYLAGVFDQSIGATQAAQRTRRALLHDPDNGYLRFELGKALAAMGERRAAVAQWRLAADAEPAWAAPHLHAARALTELELATQAVESARAAHRRAGAADVPARVAVAEARQLRLTLGGRGDSAAALLEWVESIQRDRPHEPRTLPIYVNLLAKTGQREDASEALLASLDDVLPQRTLLALARISRAHGLGLAEACYAQCEALHGRTPALARARALEAWKRGRAERAMTELRPPRDLDGDAARAWELAQARFYDEVDPPRAVERWRELLERHPDSRGAHRAALMSSAAWGDRALMRHAINRLRELTGDEAIAWRLAEARWLLEGEHADAQQVAEAVLLLGPVRRQVPELVQVRLWLARAFTRLGEPGVAIAQLRDASEHAPHHQPALLELARLLMQENEPREALVMLDRVVNNPASSVPQLQEAAAMLVRLQGWDAAVAALTRAAEAGGRTPSELLAAGLPDEEPAQADDEGRDGD